MPRFDIRLIPGLLVRASLLLHLTQRELGEKLGSSQRTAQRWHAGQAFPSDDQLQQLAIEVHPHDANLALQLALAGASTLEELGIFPPPPPPPPAPAPPPIVEPKAATPPAPPRPPVDELIDSVVCAAAEANDVMPREIRPALIAAFSRGRKLGLTMAEAEGALLASVRGTPSDPLTPPADGPYASAATATKAAKRSSSA